MFIRDSMMARLALLIGIGLVTAGNYASCAFKSGPNGGVYPEVPDVPGAPAAGTFDSTLTLRDVSGVETASFVFGEPIRFDFKIDNLTNTRQTVRFPDAQTHDFLVVNHGTVQLVWQWSEGLTFAQVPTDLVFEPNASKTFTLIWPGTLADGTNLRVGTYQARGVLVFPGFEDNPLAPSQLGSPLVAFTVR